MSVFTCKDITEDQTIPLPLRHPQWCEFPARSPATRAPALPSAGLVRLIL